jgi:hypothetical protein
MAKKCGTTADAPHAARRKQGCISQGDQILTSCVAPGISVLSIPSPFINSSSVLVLLLYLMNGGRHDGKRLIQRIGSPEKIIRGRTL